MEVACETIIIGVAHSYSCCLLRVGTQFVCTTVLLQLFNCLSVLRCGMRSFTVVVLQLPICQMAEIRKYAL